jgi:hypothetical protein
MLCVVWQVKRACGRQPGGAACLFVPCLAAWLGMLMHHTFSSSTHDTAMRARGSRYIKDLPPTALSTDPLG